MATPHSLILSLHLPLLIIFLSLHILTSSAALSDSDILLKFKDSLTNNGALSSWSTSKPPCSGDTPNWAGVLCEKNSVFGLQLESMGLGGIIDVNTLADLKSLRTLSFMDNNFEGAFPGVKQLGALKSVYLSKNKFSGEVPADAFDGMLSLKKIYLADNDLQGPIPLSLAILPKLLELRAEGNQFEGEIPEFQQTGLASVNLSNNALEGPIPARLAKMDPNSFAGNKNLCGAPLQPCNTSSKLSVGTIVIVALVVAAALAAIVAVFFILRRRRQTDALPEEKEKKVASEDLHRMEQGSPDRASSHGGKRGGEGAGRMTFLREDREKFDLPDLLKASAEILGSGCFGSSYKAAMTSTGPVMVVKRFRQMNNVAKEEFQEHMRRLGRLGHPNLLPIVAFYYRKEEKLLLTDYVDNVSLAVHLHGNHSRGHPSLNWPNRLKIVKGVGRGLLYLQNELPSLIAPHGHLKSSNVLIDPSSGDPLLTDYGLIPVVNQEQAQELMVAYKSPEYKQQGRVTRKTDAWSFGVLILEILTGKFPANQLHQGKGSDADLSNWVNSVVVRDELSPDVFDNEMRTAKECEAEMMKLLKIGLACCETDVSKRLDLKDAVEKIEEVREKEGDEDFHSTYTSDINDVRSSRGFSDDFSFSSSMNG